MFQAQALFISLSFVTQKKNPAVADTSSPNTPGGIRRPDFAGIKNKYFFFKHVRITRTDERGEERRRGQSCGGKQTARNR